MHNLESSQAAPEDSEDLLFLGKSISIRELLAAADQVAPVPIDVILLGETGTGKDKLAKYIHSRSGRKGQFVAVNCAGMPESLFESELFGCEVGAYTGATKSRMGKLESAHNGTLFLDEIESMPLSVQAKLLRVLQERRIERLGSGRPIHCNFRVVAAAKADLRDLCRTSAFRLDLYHRINIVELVIPPLRDRREDILELFSFFRKQALIEYGRRSELETPPELAAELISYEWPGNIRELKAAAIRSALGWPILPTSAKSSLQALAPLKSLRDAVDCFERHMITHAIDQHGGSVQKAAELLGLPLQTLYYRIRKLEGKCVSAKS